MRFARLRTTVIISLVSLVGQQVVMGAAPATAVSSTVTGTVFQDYNSSGTVDTTVAVGQAADVGVAGIAVAAYDRTGKKVADATSTADGTYTLNVSGNATSSLRIEFTIPSTNPLSSFVSSFAGTGSFTSIQFVNVGATGVDFGINVPGEFCQNNPNLSVSRLCAATSGVGTAASAWVTRYDGGPYTTARGWSDSYNNWDATKVATQSETGSILGMTWDPSTRRVFHAAYIRRHAAMYEVAGRPVPGAVFVTTPQGTTAAAGVGGTTSFLVDLETLLPGDQFSNSNSSGPGFVPTNAARKLQYFVDGTTDGGSENDGVDSDLVSGQDGVFEEVGRTGIGDIASDGDGNLYVVSLYDKNLYRVSMPTSGAPTTMTSLGDITSGITCTSGSARPFSVKLWRGALYMGVVCDGEQDFNPSSPAALANTNLSFTVQKYDLATSTVARFFGPHPLNTSGRIQKGHTDTMNFRDTYDAWNPWTNTYADSSTSGLPDYSTRPQPMLSEIEFDRDGSMIVAFRDRNADILGLYQSEAPDGSSTPYASFASGDLYRVCRTGTGYTSADYTFEGLAGCQGTSTHLSDPALVARQGLEYYWGDFWWKTDRDGHGEISSGLVAQGPGFPDMYTVGYDPKDGDNTDRSYFAGGIRSLLNSTGGPSGSPNTGSGVMFYAGNAAGNPNNSGGFSKTNGMSDIELLCDQAPVQIGNRVWIDTDRDGIQDPGETPVAGVTVHLYAADGTTLLGTALTNAAGEYYFASNVTETAAGNGDNSGGGLTVGVAHVIRFDNAADYASGGPLNGYVLTGTTKSEPVSALDTSIDSNASTVASYPQITTSVIRAGMNDHTYDVGFNRDMVVAMGNYTWIDADKDGVQDATEKPLAGVVVTLYTPDGSPALDVNGDAATATTDANGHYFIDDLIPGSYYAKFTLPSNYVFTARSSATGTSLNDSNPDVSTGITPVFTIGSSASGDTVADTDSTTNATFVNPTIDAGVVPKGSVSVGNFVWRDRNGDGIQGPADTGVKGAVLTLRNADGTAVRDVWGRLVKPQTTKKDGKFLFKDLPPGQYVVDIAYPTGHWPTTKDRPGRGKNSSSFRAKSLNLSAGESDTTLDFGTVRNLLRVLPATR